MAVVLEGGCRVSRMGEGEPLTIENARLWSPVDREHGAQAISLRIMEFASGLSAGICNRESDEVLYLLNGEGTTTVFIDGWAYEVSGDTGIYLRPKQTLTV